MNVLDSSGWLECLLSGPNARHFRPILNDRMTLLVPALVVYEVTKVARNGRGSAYGDFVLGLLLRGTFIEVSRDIAVNAVDVAIDKKLSTADSLIYATALEYDATLWTQDKHFNGLPRVKFFDKSA